MAKQIPSLDADSQIWEGIIKKTKEIKTWNFSIDNIN